MKVIFWDFDGTLAYRDSMWSGTLAALANERRPGANIEADRIRPHLLPGYPWSNPEVNHGVKSADRWWADFQPYLERALLSVGFDEAEAEELALKFRPAYLDAGRWGVFDDVAECLSILASRGWKHRILSNHVPELPQLVADLGLGGFFDEIITSARVGFEKPRIELFQYALRNLRGTSRAWMIGDSYSADIRGAEAAGLPAILVRKAHPEAAVCCRSLEEVPGIVDGVEGAMTLPPEE